MLAGEFHLAELVPDHQLLDGRERDGIDDRFDVEAVPGVGGHAAGRGVRVGQQAGCLEVGEDAADGRAGHAEAVALDERLRSDRRGGRDIFLDDGPKDRLCAKVQGADGAASSRQGRSPTVVSTLESRVLTRCWHRSSEASRVSMSGGGPSRPCGHGTFLPCEDPGEHRSQLLVGPTGRAGREASRGPDPGTPAALQGSPLRHLWRGRLGRGSDRHRRAETDVPHGDLLGLRSRLQSRQHP